MTKDEIVTKGVGAKGVCQFKKKKKRKRKRKEKWVKENKNADKHTL